MEKKPDRHCIRTGFSFCDCPGSERLHGMPDALRPFAVRIIVRTCLCRRGGDDGPSGCPIPPMDEVQVPRHAFEKRRTVHVYHLSNASSGSQDQIACTVRPIQRRLQIDKSDDNRFIEPLRYSNPRQCLPRRNNALLQICDGCLPLIAREGGDHFGCQRFPVARHGHLVAKQRNGLCC